MYRFKISALAVAGLLLLGAGNVAAQGAPAQQSSLVYVSAGFGRDLLQQRSWFGNFGLTAIARSGWGGSVQMRLGNFTAKNLPADYKGGFSLFGDPPAPIDAYHAYSIHLVKEFFQAQQRFRYGLEAGPSIIRYDEEIFRPYAPVPQQGMGINVSLGDKTYTHARLRREGFGISLKAKAEFPLARTTGFEIAAVSNINPMASILGLELSWNIGRMRDAIPEN